jgi:hypothetical protein
MARKARCCCGGRLRRFAERLQLVEKARSVDFVELPYLARHG